MRFLIFIVVFLYSIVLLVSAQKLPGNIPQDSCYERMQFSIKWGFGNIVSVGTGLIESYKEAPRGSFVIHTYAKSNKFFTLFYPVDSWSITKIDSAPWEPKNLFYKTRQNKYFRYAEVSFAKDTIFYRAVKQKNYEGYKKAKLISVPRNGRNHVFDFFSALFKVRDMQWQVGDTVSLDIFDDVQQNLFTMKVVILRQEVIPTIFGDNTSCVVAYPILGDHVGVFVKDGPLYIWFTDDERKIPVRVEVILGMPIGAISMELESYIEDKERCSH